MLYGGSFRLKIGNTMTDTLDTNLPQKPVELEEEQKTAEVAEPVATETSADK